MRSLKNEIVIIKTEDGHGRLRTIDAGSIAFSLIEAPLKRAVCNSVAWPISVALRMEAENDARRLAKTLFPD